MSSPSKSSSPTKQSPSKKSQNNSPSTKSSSDSKLRQLDYLDSYFSSFASRVEKIDRSIDTSKPSTLVQAKHDLAQIINDLESLQSNEVS